MLVVLFALFGVSFLLCVVFVVCFVFGLLLILVWLVVLGDCLFHWVCLLF